MVFLNIFPKSLAAFINEFQKSVNEVVIFSISPVDLMNSDIFLKTLDNALINAFNVFIIVLNIPEKSIVASNNFSRASCNLFESFINLLPLIFILPNKEINLSITAVINCFPSSITGSKIYRIAFNIVRKLLRTENNPSNIFLRRKEVASDIWSLLVNALRFPVKVFNLLPISCA